MPKNRKQLGQQIGVRTECCATLERTQRGILNQIVGPREIARQRACVAAQPRKTRNHFSFEIHS